MFAITDAEIAQHSQLRLQQFAEQICHNLRKDYPELWQALPFELATRLIADRMQYATQQHGIERMDSLSLFLYLCSAIGAAFDQQNDIAAALSSSTDPDELMHQLADSISDVAWQEAEAQSNLEDWFNQTSLSQLDQVAIRSCWALRNTPHPLPTDEANLLQSIQPWLQTAEQHHITDVRGQVAVVIANLVFGEQFYELSEPDWLQQIFHSPDILPAVRGFTLANCIEATCHLTL